MSQPLVLVVEDSDEDFTAFTRIARECYAHAALRRAVDGDDALDYLYHQGCYTCPEDAPRPSLILLDLNLPGTDGRDVIRQVKQDQQLRNIPIVVFSTSANVTDIQICYDYGINSYLLKPIGVERLRQTLSSFFRYWFDNVVLPNLEATS